MKNIFLTTVFSLFTIFASAQLMVTSSLSSQGDGEEWSLDGLTDNLGVGYSFNKVTVGVVTNGDNYDLFGRYSINDNLYVSGLITEEDEKSLGAGYYIKVWDKLYLDPSYVYNTSRDNDMCDDMGMGKEGHENKGEFKLGITYKF